MICNLIMYYAAPTMRVHFLASLMQHVICMLKKYIIVPSFPLDTLKCRFFFSKHMRYESNLCYLEFSNLSVIVNTHHFSLKSTTPHLLIVMKLVLVWGNFFIFPFFLRIKCANPFFSRYLRLWNILINRFRSF